MVNMLAFNVLSHSNEFHAVSRTDDNNAIANVSSKPVIRVVKLFSQRSLTAGIYG